MMPAKLTALRLLTPLVVGLALATLAHSAPLADGVPVRGWILLSDNESKAFATIDAASRYDINHLQLSHHLVHDLREIKEDAKRAVVNRLTDAAHAAGITEVVLWDHALYPLNYYPSEFRTGPNGTLDLDNPAFWDWFKQDYREMLDRVPNIDGLILTFIETGARAERQHSTRLKTDQEKLAAVVDAVAEIVIGERKLNLYARTFSYTHAEYDNVIGAVNLFKRPDIRLMMKETPHDFFLTHPNDEYAGTIARPTLMEFDIAGEFNGQGIIATTWPKYILRRWRDFAARPHIIGYSARVDRYGDTHLIGRPAEINLHAIKRGFEDPQFTAEQAYDEFIAERYGIAALPHVKAAFKNAFDIVTSSLYTLGTNVANHSKLNYDPYASSFARHVSGKWFNPPISYVAHDINREFHQWRDVVDHLAPPFLKDPSASQWKEVPWVLDREWVHPDERMNEEYLRYVITEKNHGVALAEDSAQHIAAARDQLSPENHEQLYHHFQHTLLTARLHRATASAYYGFRVWCRGGEHRTPFVEETVRSGLTEMREVAQLIRDYLVKPPKGQWTWIEDAAMADRYFNWIVTEGWPKENRGIANPYGGMTFPFSNP